ncbi:Solute carrier family 46 member 3 [Nymphon striatum]|nr:Solute carrier family 46 member 3 [Nymphon striatum]
MESTNCISRQDLDESFKAIPKETSSSSSGLLKALKLCFNISIEPILFLMMFAVSLVSTTNVTFMMKMVCSSEKNYSAEVCQNFLDDDQYEQQKIIIQKSTNNWGIINSVVTVLPTVCLSLFAGPWSDKYGRKLPLILPFTGSLISSAMLIAISYIDYDYPPYTIIIVNISNGLTGSYITQLIAFTYIADITSKEDRSVKYIFVEGITMLGLPLGNLLAGYIHKLYGFGPVYILALSCQICAMVYGTLFLKETQGIDNEDSWKTRMKYFFSLNTLKSGLRAFLRARSGHNRLLLVFMFFSMLAFMFFINLQYGVVYMYTQLIFDWDQWTYSIFQSSTNFALLTFLIIIAPLITYIFKIPDVVLGIFGSFSGITSVIIMGIVRSTILFYIGGFVGVLQAMIPPLIRSAITKIVDADEIVSLVYITNVTFLMQMVCSSEKNYSKEVCQNFLVDDQYEQQKIIIQKSTNNWGIINSVVTVLPTVCLSLFAGPWSDKYGRKLPLILPFTGSLISSAMLIAISYIDYDYPPYTIIIANIPNGLTGSSITMLIGFTYIADITSKEDRSVKYIFVEGITMLGIPLGNLVAGYIHKLYGFGPVYILALACQICAIVYGTLFLKETQGIDNEDSWKTRMKYFFRGFVGIFFAMIPPLMRSAITKTVRADEIGKIFALVSSLELATPIFAAVIYSQVYNNTVEFFPSCCYFMAGFVFMWPMITFMSMDLFSKSPQKNDECQPILGSVNQKP